MFRGPSFIVSTMQEETTPIFKRLWYGTFHLVCMQFYMLSGPTHPVFACNTQWKCIGGLIPPTNPSCVSTKWKAPMTGPSSNQESNPQILLVSAGSSKFNSRVNFLTQENLPISKEHSTLEPKAQLIFLMLTFWPSICTDFSVCNNT